MAGGALGGAAWGAHAGLASGLLAGAQQGPTPRVATLEPPVRELEDRLGAALARLDLEATWYLEQLTLVTRGEPHSRLASGRAEIVDTRFDPTELLALSGRASAGAEPARATRFDSAGTGRTSPAASASSTGEKVN
jgi:hypothetical protein